MENQEKIDENFSRIQENKKIKENENDKAKTRIEKQVKASQGKNPKEK